MKLKYFKITIKYFKKTCIFYWTKKKTNKIRLTSNGPARVDTQVEIIRTDVSDDGWEEERRNWGHYSLRP